MYDVSYDESFFRMMKQFLGYVVDSVRPSLSLSLSLSPPFLFLCVPSQTQGALQRQVSTRGNKKGVAADWSEWSSTVNVLQRSGPKTSTSGTARVSTR